VIRVALADDQELVRAGFAALLDAEDDIEVVGEAADGLQAVRTAEQRRPDVMLMDIRMPVLDGIEAIRRIAARPELSSVHVIILTTFELDEYVFEGLRAGAAGFLVKDTDAAELIRAVRVVAGGGALCSRTRPAWSAPAGRKAGPESGPTALGGHPALPHWSREPPPPVDSLIGAAMTNFRARAQAGACEGAQVCVGMVVPVGIVMRAGTKG
jgi:DNA-binding NarL/FixJ family response regulator